jgi:hypothetical protein
MKTTQDQLRKKHGTPKEFEAAVEKALNNGEISVQEAKDSISIYRKEWIEATKVLDLYVLQRKDTGEYYKSLKSNPHHMYKPDSPQRKNWISDVESAKFYNRRGIRVILTQERNSLQSDVKYHNKPSYEIVAVRVNVVEVETMSW